MIRSSLLVGALLGIAVVVMVLLLPVRVVDQFRPSNEQSLLDGVTAAQTFVAPVDRLAAVGLFLTVEEETSRPALLVHLREEGSDRPVRSGRIPLDDELMIPSDIPRPLWFAFPPIAHSGGRVYELSTEGASGVHLLASLGDAYSQGTAVINGDPVNYDLSLAVAHRGQIVEGVRRLAPGVSFWFVVPSLLVVAMVWGALTAHLLRARAWSVAST